MTPWVLRLIVANIAVFFVTASMPILMRALAFVPALILQRPWTILTYMFVHAGIWHLAFNMIGLFFFGPRLEARLGGRRFAVLYFLSGLMGGLLSLTTPSAAIVGASGAVFGVLYGFAHYWPHERIYIWGVLPVPARGMVLGLAGISLYLGFTGGGGNVAHFAHLGGFVGGWGYLKWIETRKKAFKKKTTPQAPSPLEKVSGKARRDEEAWKNIDLDSLHEVNREEVERLLEKVEESGTQSLTPSERDFLNRMS